MSAVSSRVLRFHETGEPLDVLRDEHAQVADPPTGCVRVKVLATGLNPADWELCRGFMPGTLPRGIGFDVAGVVDAVGPDAFAGNPAAGDTVAVGDVVFGTADFVGQPSAGVAEYAILNSWFRVPEGLEAAQAATLPMVVQTAAWTLDLLNLSSGDAVLVHGAGGMVGYAAVQIALSRGLTVMATAGSTFAKDLEGFGARVTSYGDGMVGRVRELTGGKDVDAVFDAARPGPGAMAGLIELAGGDPRRVVTIGNHDEARSLGARVNIDELATVDRAAAG